MKITRTKPVEVVKVKRPKSVNKPADPRNKMKVRPEGESNNVAK